MEAIKIKKILKETEQIGLNSHVTVKGWVRTKRGNNNVAFINLNDGSIVHGIQIVVDVAKFDE